MGEDGAAGVQAGMGGKEGGGKGLSRAGGVFPEDGEECKFGLDK